jgi:hypothetical protein
MITDEQRPLQFGIRHLLGAMFAVALASALIGPWVRGWSAGQWLVLSAQTGMEALIFALCMGGHVLLRRATSNPLGEIHFRVPAQIEGSGPWNPVNAYVLLGLATIVLVLLTASTIMAEGKLEGPGPFFYGAFAGVFGAMGVTQLWHPSNEVLIGDRGVAIAGRFLPWDQLWCAYAPGQGSAPLFLKTDGWAFAVFPDAETEPPLAEFLRQRARPWHIPPPRRKK